MEDEISKTEWKIIELLSIKDRTTTELAQLLKMSIPTVYLLLRRMKERKVIYKKENRKGKTRPYSIYSLGEGFIYFVKALPRDAEKKFLVADDNLKIHLNIWKVPQREFHYYLERFWWEMQDDLEKIEGIAVFGSVAGGNAREDSDIDILILTREKNKNIEAKYGTKIIKNPNGKGKMAIVESFAKDDFVKSLKSSSKFAREVIKKMIIIYDPDNFLSNLRGDKDGFK